MKMLLPGERHGRYEGRKQGRQEGRQEGRQQEAANLMVRQARRRFAGFGPEDEAAIRDLSLPNLESLSDALWDLESLLELRRWLADHGTHHETAAGK